MRQTILSRAAVAALALAGGSAVAQSVTFSTVATDPYFAGDINSCAVGINNLTTVGNHQFIAYYNAARNVMIGRRTLGSSTWQTFNSGLTSPTAAQITDDHNVIAVAVDGAGYMHASWNMHNQSLRYAISNAPVTGATLNPIAFTPQTSVNAPTLFPGGGTTANSVTYPQFYNIPGSNNLLFMYRNGGAGGGSGNGNQYFNLYDPATRQWTNNLVIDGASSSVNGYINTLAPTSSGELMMSWTWRASPAWQTNSNIMFAKSPDHGTTWQRQDGTPYTLPITQSGPSAGQVIKAIPQNSSLINQTSMSVDNNDRPIVATWWAPGWNPATGSGNPNRQYMLVHYDGAAWRTSQITNRTTDTAIDTSSFAVRDLGRPIVLVDDADCVLVVTRSTDTSMGAFSNPATADNEILIYYNTVAGLNSLSPTPWQSVTLDTANMGSWEPTYDANLWSAQKKLSLFYEPVGLSGQTGSTLRVLDWDPAAYFANLKVWSSATGGNWDNSANWSGGVPDAVSASANFGGGIAPASDCTITISGTKTIGALSFGSPIYKYSLVSGSSGALSLDNGAGLAATISATSGSHTISVPVTIAAAGVDVGVADGATLKLAGNLGGSGALEKSTGGGVLALSGTNTQTGGTRVTAGRLRIVTASALSSGNLSIDGGILESAVNVTRTLGDAANRMQVPGGISGFAASGAEVTFAIQNGSNPVSWGSATFNPTTLVLNHPTSTHNVTLAGDISLGGAARSLHVNPGTNTLSGVISSPTGSLNVNGPGTLVVSNTNTYGGGTTLNSIGQGPATVRTAADNALGTGTITMGPQGNGTTARLELVGGITLPNNVTFTGRTNSSVGIRNVAGDNVLSGRVTAAMGGSIYRIESAAEMLTLAGGLTSSATGGRQFTLEGAGNGTVSGTIANGSAVVSIAKSGAGTWVLSGANTYSGTTTANAGTLVIDNSLTTTSAVIVANGATIRIGSSGHRLLGTKLVDVHGGGKLDITDNDVIVDYTGSSPEFALRDKVLLARDGDMEGIFFTGFDDDFSDKLLAFGEASELEISGFNGITIDDTTVVGKYTYYGDANCDGQVTTDDYVAVDLGLGTGDSWVQGDFDLNGSVTTDDYVVVDLNLGKGTDNPLAYAEEQAAMIALHTEMFGQSYLDKLNYAMDNGWVMASVPEPCFAFLLAPVAGLLTRSRRA